MTEPIARTLNDEPPAGPISDASRTVEKIGNDDSLAILMRHAALSTAIGLLFAVSAQPGLGSPPCDQGEQAYRKKADLPRGAAEAIGVAMAEKGAPYQRGDVMQPGLPLYRFVSATRSGCRIRINYEQGGIAHRWGTFSLFHIAGAWRVTGTR